MSRFIQTDAGEINLQFVVSVVPVNITPKGHNPRSRRCRVTYLQGREVLTTLMVDDQGVSALAAPVVPALADYFVVDVDQSEPFDVYAQSIVAWRIEDHSASPVCLDEICGNDWGILTPSGKVTVPMSCTYDSINSFRTARIAELHIAAGVAPPPPDTETTTGIPFSSYIAQGWSLKQMKDAGVIAADAKTETL